MLSAKNYKSQPMFSQNYPKNKSGMFLIEKHTVCCLQTQKLAERKNTSCSWVLTIDIYMVLTSVLLC